MFRRRDFVICVIFTYVILTILFYMLKEKPIRVNQDVCGIVNLCVRFCCYNKSTCKDTFIRKNFNSTELIKTSLEYKILYGHPSCNLESIGSEENWDFYSYGIISAEEFFYDYNEYCLQDYQKDDQVGWNLFLCRPIELLQQRLSYALITTSVLLLLSTVFVYASIKDLRTIPGKCVRGFVCGFISMYISLPFVNGRYMSVLQDISVLTLFAGFLLSFLWMNVLCFDIWRTFRNVLVTSESLNRYKYYCIYVYTLVVLILIALIIETFATSGHKKEIFIFIYFGFYLEAFVDVIFLVLTGVRIFKISKTMNFNEHAWFETEKERFWSCCGAFGIMMITFILEVNSLWYFGSYHSKIIVDIMKCFSALLIFVIFVLNPKTRELISNRYESLKSTH